MKMKNTTVPSTLEKIRMRILDFLSTIPYFLLIYSLSAHSQILLGIKGGVNLNTVNVDTRNIDYTVAEWLPSLNIGLAADVGITDYFSIRPELLFSQKGYQTRKYRTLELYTNLNKIYSDVYSRTTNYVELPVLANYYYQGERFKIALQAGPYGAFLLGGTENISLYLNDLGDLSALKQKNVTANYKLDTEYGGDKKIDTRFDFGAAGGISMGYKIKNGWLMLEGRYNYGLVDLNTFQGEKPKNYTALYNSNFAITLGYLMIIKPAKKKKIVEEESEKEESDEEQNNSDN